MSTTMGSSYPTRRPSGCGENFRARRLGVRAATEHLFTASHLTSPWRSRPNEPPPITDAQLAGTNAGQSGPRLATSTLREWRKALCSTARTEIPVANQAAAVVWSWVTWESLAHAGGRRDCRRQRRRTHNLRIFSRTTTVRSQAKKPGHQFRPLVESPLRRRKESVSADFIFRVFGVLAAPRACQTWPAQVAPALFADPSRILPPHAISHQEQAALDIAQKSVFVFPTLWPGSVSATARRVGALFLRQAGGTSWVSIPPDFSSSGRRSMAIGPLTAHAHASFPPPSFRLCTSGSPLNEIPDSRRPSTGLAERAGISIRSSAKAARI